MRRVMLSIWLIGSMLGLLVACVAPSGQDGAAPAGEKDEIIFSALGDPNAMAEHPWSQLVEEYNAAHPEVEVVVVAGLGWDALGTMILAGNAPDLMHVSMAGIFSAVPQMPYAVNVAPYLTEEDIADFGPLFNNLRHPADPDHILGFPVELRPEPEICANLDLFEEAGIDWQKIRAEGWTWDEFIEAAQKMTIDANGKHANEADFDPENIARWAWVDVRDGLAWQVGITMMNNGLAQFTGPGTASVGSQWDLTGPLAAESAQFVQDWLYKYHIADPATRAWGDPQFMQSFQYLIDGRGAMNSFGGATCLGGVAMYNQAIDNGEIAGEKLEARLWPLPTPYNAANMQSEVYSIRPIYLQMMSQEPYKGDKHTENVVNFAKWFISTETQIHLCKELSKAPCPLPARESVRSAILTDPARLADIDYMLARGKSIPQLGHPANSLISQQVWGPLIDQLLANEINGEQFAEQLGQQAQPFLDDWVNNATEQDAALINIWCTIPSWFPGPHYPNYTPQISEACQAKVEELGIATQ